MRVLRIRYDNGETRTFPLTGDHIVLGRSPSAHLSCPRDFALSRTHCVFDREAADWTIEDSVSRNGTFVNGARLNHRARLRPDDTLVAGHLIITYADPEAVVPDPASAPVSLPEIPYDLDATVIEEADPSGKPLPSPSRDPQPTSLAWLNVVSHGPHFGNRYNLAKEFEIGRNWECNLILNDRSVSRHHARIFLENRRYYLYSIGANGTYLNDVRLRERGELRDRDEIRISGIVLQFIQPIGQEELTAPGKRRLREFDQDWKDLSAAARLDARAEFAVAAEHLVRGPLSEALGLQVEAPIPSQTGIAGFMVQAPGLRIRKSHFPILVVSYSEDDPGLRQAVSVQLTHAMDYFVLFIVVPARDAVVDEARELRKHIVDRVNRHDLIVLDQQHLAELIGVGTPERLLSIVLQQGIELSVLSPYILAGAVSDQMFFGRDKEVKRIKTVQPDGHATSYAVVGGRRIGKSSIVHKLTSLMNQEPELYWARLINCEAFSDYAGFFQTLSEELAIECRGEDPAAFRSLVLSLRREHPEREIVFLFDEVDALLRFDSVQNPAARLASVFRSLAHDQICRFVFSGSRTLFGFVRDPDSPFFNFCQNLILEPLDSASLTQIIIQPLTQLGIQFEDEEAMVERLLDLTSCHPNLAQWFCDRLLNVITAHRITMADVEKVAASREFCIHYVTTSWGDARPLEKLISLLMPGPSFDSETLLAALAQRGIIDSGRIQKALDMLQLTVLLEREDSRFRFRLSYFPQMVRRYQDLDFQIQTQLAELRK